MAGLLIVVLLIGLGFVGYQRIFQPSQPGSPTSAPAPQEGSEQAPAPPSAPIDLIRQPNQIRERVGNTLETESSRQVEQMEGL